MPMTSAMTIAIDASCIVTGSFSSDQREHRLLDPHRFAEIAGQHALDPIDVLHRQRPIEMILPANLLDDLGVALFARHDQRRIARQEMLQRERSAPTRRTTSG